MLTIKGIYDGKKIKPLEKVKVNRKYKVLITFLEEILDEEEEIRDFASNSDAFDFWHDEREDLYEEYITQK